MKNYFHYAKLFILMAAGSTYDTIYHLSNQLGITWVDVNLSIDDIYDAPEPDFVGFDILLIMGLLLGAFFYLNKKIQDGLQNKEITNDDVKRIYIKFASLYFFSLILLIIFAPILIPIFRTWV